MLRPSGVEERNYFIAFWKTNVCQLKSARFDQMQFSFKEIQLEFFFIVTVIILLFVADDAADMWRFAFIGREKRSARPNSL